MRRRMKVHTPDATWAGLPLLLTIALKLREPSLRKHLEDLPELPVLDQLAARFRAAFGDPPAKRRMEVPSGPAPERVNREYKGKGRSRPCLDPKISQKLAFYFLQERMRVAGLEVPTAPEFAAHLYRCVRCRDEVISAQALLEQLQSEWAAEGVGPGSGGPGERRRRVKEERLSKRAPRHPSRGRT